MKKNMIPVHGFLLIMILIPALIILFFFVYISLTDYKPSGKTEITPTSRLVPFLPINRPFSITTFNIGYCGLDSARDFFMDGGKGSGSASKEQTWINLKQITAFLQNQHSDLLFIQEVDRKAKRSFYLDELSYMERCLSNYSMGFAINYKVAFVPVPLFHPMGSVLSGLALFSGYKADSWFRYQYPGRENWSRQLFELDRCFLETRIPVKTGKTLVLINSHLSAFDKGGLIRKQQLQFLQEHIMSEYRQGNYVVVGGDWNHSLPNTNPDEFPHQEASPDWLQNLPADFTPPGFKWACDVKTPSVRTDARPYREGANYTAVVDGFLVSPNVEILSIKGHQLHFANSDHNPVTAEFRLN